MRDRQLRDAYEHLPYPATNMSRPTAWWRLPPPVWLNAVWRPGTPRFAPARILVAGCGTGLEAFALAAAAPDAEVVAVDFSARSIETARKFQRRVPGSRRLRFLVADLDDARLPRVTGGGFDFVSCHGVLSYVAEPTRVLRNLYQCLAPDGALYIGVNGAEHHSLRWRKALASFGLDPRIYRQDRRILRVLDAMVEHTPLAPKFAQQTAPYLASDLYGPRSRDWPLEGWLAVARRAKLHFRGSFHCGRSLGGLSTHGLTRDVMPRSRASYHALEELLIPAAFHRLLFTRARPALPPWDDPQRLLDWRVVRLKLYGVPRSRARTRVAHLVSKALKLSLDVPVTRWTRPSLLTWHGPRTVRDLVGAAPTAANLSQARDELYELYLLSVIELLPPDVTGQATTHVP